MSHGLNSWDWKGPLGPIDEIPTYTKGPSWFKDAYEVATKKEPTFGEAEKWMPYSALVEASRRVAEEAKEAGIACLNCGRSEKTKEEYVAELERKLADTAAELEKIDAENDHLSKINTIVSDENWKLKEHQVRREEYLKRLENVIIRHDLAKEVDVPVDLLTHP